MKHPTPSQYASAYLSTLTEELAACVATVKTRKDLKRAWSFYDRVDNAVASFASALNSRPWDRFDARLRRAMRVLNDLETAFPARSSQRSRPTERPAFDLYEDDSYYDDTDDVDEYDNRNPDRG